MQRNIDLNNRVLLALGWHHTTCKELSLSRFLTLLDTQNEVIRDGMIIHLYLYRPIQSIPYDLSAATKRSPYFPASPY